MSNSTIDITEARRQINTFDDRLRLEKVIWVTRHNKKAFAVVDIELLETVFETLDILNDPQSLKMLQDSLDDVRNGRVYDHEDVKEELL